MNWFLYGVLLVQVYLYYLAFPGDSRRFKAIVWVLFFLETVQSVLLGYDGIFAFGLGYGDSQKLDKVNLSWFSVPFLGAFISSIVQCFFSWRIYTLSGSWITSAIVCLMSALQGCTSIVQAIFSLEIGRYSLIPSGTKITFPLWLVSTAVCDLTIAVCMAYFLSTKRSGVHQTNVLLARLTQLCIETGSLTAVFAVVTAAMELGFPTKTYFIPPTYTMVKLYSNSFMMILNSRIHPMISNGHTSRGTSRARGESFGPMSHLRAQAQGGEPVDLSMFTLASNTNDEFGVSIRSRGEVAQGYDVEKPKAVATKGA